MTSYQRKPLRVTQMQPSAHNQAVACLIVPEGVETLTANQVDALIDKLLACKERAKRGQG